MNENNNNNILEFGELDDFDVTFIINNNFDGIDFNDLSFNVFNPIFEKLLTSNDQNEIIKILKEVGTQILQIISHIDENSDGSKDDKNIDEKFIDSIHLVPDLIKKPVLIKDKYIKCALRLLKDFSENVNIVTTIIQLTYINNVKAIHNLDLLNICAIPYCYSKKKYNSPILSILMMESFNRRRDFLIFPLNNDYKELIKIAVDLSVSNIESIQNNCIDFIQFNINYYSPFINSVLIERIFNKMESIEYKSFVLFLSKMPVKKLLLDNDFLLCKTISFLLQNFDSCKQLNPKRLVSVFFKFCIKSLPNETYDSNKQEYIDLLNQIEKNYMLKNSINRTYNLILIFTIYLCLKNVKDVNEKILEFITKNITRYISDVSVNAFNCLIMILVRRQKFTKEKVSVNEIIKIKNFPSVLNQVSVKLPDNGIYFPFNTQDENLKESSSVDDNSPDSLPSGSLDVNIQVIETNKEIKNIFDTFEKIEIEWKNDQLFERDYFNYYPIDSCPFKRESYTIRKYEFINDSFLIKNIKNIFASAMNSLNDNSAQNKIPYNSIWRNYGLTVGPYCIDKLHKLSKQYLTQYYQSSSNITAKVVFDDFFIVHNEFEFDFFSSLVKEMMNSSLTLQLSLSVCLNTNIENIIFYIPLNDYEKFEEILLKYNRFVIEKNLGNKMKLNIAKILGVFEIRKCTFVENSDKMSLEDNLVKAGSIILNSYLFDHIDEKVEKAFKFIEKFSDQ